MGNIHLTLDVALNEITEQVDLYIPPKLPIPNSQGDFSQMKMKICHSCWLVLCMVYRGDFFFFWGGGGTPVFFFLGGGGQQTCFP